ncbi:glucose/arabinose dehydrogenase [Planifilum fimeticola]|uniref:Glucose/arabinose dehydrogenase n=1 Tax=Planifilum fimeticola TaxID=201975 RepID=A0A2T0LEX2_9BACL|nr:glucose/arabinose dehydrogenase [Planifilum fimeticola]
MFVHWNRRVLITLLFSFLAACSSPEDKGAQPDPREERGEGGAPSAEIVVDGLSAPWEVEFAGEDIYIAEREGKIVKVRGGKKERQPLSLSRPVVQEGESGFLGLALAPDFEKTRRAYAYHTYREGDRLLNRVILLEETDRGWVEVRPLLEGIPGGVIHDGGRLRVGPDERLYITTGDAGDEENAQNRRSLAGKILRLKLDGTVPADNPIPGSPVYSWGHRNPQGLDWSDEGELYASEHGPSGMPSGHDEINRIEPGKNYGWPEIIGNETRKGMESPLFHSGSDTWAPSGLAVSGEKVYVACLRGEQVRVFDLKRRTSEAFLEDLGRIRDVAIRDGYLYLLTNNTDGRGDPRQGDDKLLRVKLGER